MANVLNVLLHPLITEKATIAKENANQYSFAVRTDASKGDIKEAVHTLFKVKVRNVRTSIQRGKLRRMGKYQGYQPDWKKAIVTLAQGQKIDFEKL